MGFFPQISLNEFITMMSDQDRELLAKLGPDLMKSVIIDGSDLLAQLRAKRALTDQQKAKIEAINYTTSVTFWAPVLFKADKVKFLTLQDCITNKTEKKLK